MHNDTLPGFCVRNLFFLTILTFPGNLLNKSLDHFTGWHVDGHNWQIVEAMTALNVHLVMKTKITNRREKITSITLAIPPGQSARWIFTFDLCYCYNYKVYFLSIAKTRVLFSMCSGLDITLQNQSGFSKIQTFKWYMSKFHDNLTFSSQVPALINATIGNFSRNWKKKLHPSFCMYWDLRLSST